MPLLVILFILETVLVVSLTIRVAYVTNNEAKREKILANHKAKHGEFAYDVYRKVYTPRFLAACALISLASVLYVASKVLEASQEHASIVSVIIGGASVVITAIGLYRASFALRKE